jgi:hypothetical protein
MADNDRRTVLERAVEACVLGDSASLGDAVAGRVGGTRHCWATGRFQAILFEALRR